MTTPLNQDPRYKTEIFDGDKVIPGRKSCANALEIDLHFGIWPGEVSDNSDSTINSLRHLHNELKGGWTQIAREHLKVAEDDSEWPKKRREQSSKFAETKTNHLEQKFKDVEIAAQARAIELEHEISRSLEGTISSEARSQEIRATIRSMPQEERNKILQSANFGEDDELMRAIATGHELTVGVGASSIKAVRERYLEKAAPFESKRLREVQAGLELVKKAKDAYIRNITQFAQALPQTIPDLDLKKRH